MFDNKFEAIIQTLDITLEIQIKLDDYKIVHQIQDINVKEQNKIKHFEILQKNQIQMLK